MIIGKIVPCNSSLISLLAASIFPGLNYLALVFQKTKMVTHHRKYLFLRLRNSNHFALPRFNLDTGRNSIRYRGPLAWALTPTSLKQSTSLKNFKKFLKQRRHKLFIKNISFVKEACMVSHKDQDFTYF